MGRRRDELCQTSVGLKAERVVALAQIRPSRSAPAACPAGHAGSRDDAVSDVQARDLSADGRDLPDELVAEYDRHFISGHRMCLCQRDEVRAVHHSAASVPQIEA